MVSRSMAACTLCEEVRCAEDGVGGWGRRGGALCQEPLKSPTTRSLSLSPSLPPSPLPDTTSRSPKGARTKCCGNERNRCAFGVWGEEGGQVLEVLKFGKGKGKGREWEEWERIEN